MAYRSQGSLPVPLSGGSGREVSNSLPATMRGPDKNYAVQRRIKLERGVVCVCEEIYESVDSLSQASPSMSQVSASTHPHSRATLRARLGKVHTRGRAQTREADVIREVKRASMKEKWGLSLAYRVTSCSLELLVTKVAMHSPVDKVGMKEGNTITMVNDWKVEAMEHPQAALSILLAGGFLLSIGWVNNTERGEGWQDMGSY